MTGSGCHVYAYAPLHLTLIHRLKTAYGPLTRRFPLSEAIPISLPICKRVSRLQRASVPLTSRSLIGKRGSELLGDGRRGRPPRPGCPPADRDDPLMTSPSSHPLLVLALAGANRLIDGECYTAPPRVRQQGVAARLAETQGIADGRS